ncbi:MAG: tetratricopeptide repeat protein, partial [Chloroflexota bacterium]|nr:tetratricopeptide repeat protein [Chloroflexota bacterium]
ERYADAEPLFLAMIAASDQNGDVTHHRMALGFLYLLTEDYPRAERLFHEALVFNEHARHWARTATTYADLGLLAWLQGDIATADLHVQRVETMSARMDALNPNFQALRWAVDARRGSPEAMAALDALRREPGFGWGNREIAHTIIRRLERDGTLPPLSA